MTPAQTAKSMGLKSLTQARDMLGTNKNGHPMVSLNTLTNWHRNKPELFEVVMLGCLVKFKEEEGRKWAARLKSNELFPEELKQ